MRGVHDGVKIFDNTCNDFMCSVLRQKSSKWHTER